MTKNLALSLTALTLAFGLTGCKSDEVRGEQLAQNNSIQDGTYVASRCYQNGIETTAALGSARYTKGSITFNTNGTGSASYVVYTDAACTVLSGANPAASTRNLTLSSVTATKIDNVSVIKLDQNGTAGLVSWWIPANGAANNGYAFDVDAAVPNHTPGPFLFEPTPTQVQAFGANPSIGVTFTKQ